MVAVMRYREPLMEQLHHGGTKCHEDHVNAPSASVAPLTFEVIVVLLHFACRTVLR